MKKITFNHGWTVTTGVQDPFAVIMGAGGTGKPVTLPQDAMILEKRDPNCPSGNQSGFYPAKTYTYEKEMDVPADWENRQVYVEFEGVMSRAFVYLNGEIVAENRNGYTQFFADLSPYLRCGRKNTLKVVAVNQEHGSRWYPGSGIYRNVNLYLGERMHLLPEGVRIATRETDPGRALLDVETMIKNSGVGAARLLLSCEILDREGNVVMEETNTISLMACEKIATHMRIAVEYPDCWSPEHPYLYRCRLTLREKDRVVDEWEERFGIRTISADAVRGLRINGKQVKLRGACVHHDNGLIGATTLRDAEEFRLRKLKAAGFNSIRSAHHPAGKTLLDICDELGILVMDELTDMWDQPKNSGDYALEFGRDWREQMERMVSKDYNHPSVICYSLGNEIPEIGRRSGGRRTRQLACALRSLDDTRLITCAFSGFLAVTDAMGEISREMSAPQTEESGRAGETAESGESRGSEGLNAAMGNTQQSMLDAFAVSPVLSDCLEEASCELDVVGYNYLTARHVFEHSRHPQRVVVGSETYPTEIARLWKIVKEHPHVIGDFTWTGYDYIGEAGIAIRHYDSDRPDQGWYPDRLAYCGDINLNGYRRPVSYLREIVYGLRREPFAAVERPERIGHSCRTNDWMYADAIDSWTFAGFEGTEVTVHVLSPSEEVELFLNGKSCGRKPSGEACGCDTVYQVPYEPGELMAVGYTGGREDGRFLLSTAGKPEQLLVEASRLVLEAGGQSAVFLTVDLADAQGRPNRQEKRNVTVKVKGAGVLAGFGSADPSCEGSYQDAVWETFDGRVLAVVRSADEAGSVRVTFAAEGCGEKTLEIPVTRTPRE